MSRVGRGRGTFLLWLKPVPRYTGRLRDSSRGLLWGVLFRYTHRPTRGLIGPVRRGKRDSPVDVSPSPGGGRDDSRSPVVPVDRWSSGTPEVNDEAPCLRRGGFKDRPTDSGGGSVRPLWHVYRGDSGPDRDGRGGVRQSPRLPSYVEVLLLLPERPEFDQVVGALVAHRVAPVLQSEGHTDPGSRRGIPLLEPSRVLEQRKHDVRKMLRFVRGSFLPHSLRVHRTPFLGRPSGPLSPDPRWKVRGGTGVSSSRRRRPPKRRDSGRVTGDSSPFADHTRFHWWD